LQFIPAATSDIARMTERGIGIVVVSIEIPDRNDIWLGCKCLLWVGSRHAVHR
jgi:hypothetical protein